MLTVKIIYFLPGLVLITINLSTLLESYIILIFFFMLLRLRMLLIVLVWNHKFLYFFKFPCWFVVKNPPLVLIFSVVGTVLILIRYLDSPNIPVLDYLSSKTHDLIPYLSSCWYHYHTLIWTWYSPVTASVFLFVILDTVSDAGTANCSVVAWALPLHFFYFFGKVWRYMYHITTTVALDSGIAPLNEC